VTLSPPSDRASSTRSCSTSRWLSNTREGFGSIVVELADKRGQHLLDRELAIVAGEIGTVAPILSAAEEKHLDAGLSACLVCSDHVRIDDPWDVNVLVALDQRQRADPVPDQRRRLEIKSSRNCLHFGREALLNVIAPAGEERVRLLDQSGVVVAADAADAGRAAPLDLETAGKGGCGRKDAVAARPQQERLLQGYQGAIDRARRGKRGRNRCRPCSVRRGVW